MHAHARVHACAHRSLPASQGCLHVHYMCECVCCYYFANPSTVSVCLYMYVRVSWCLYIQCWGAIHVQQAFDVRSNSCHIHSYVHTLTHIQHFHSSTALCTKPQETCKLTQAMKARQKCRLAGPTTGCWTTQETCIEEKQRVRQTAVVYTLKNQTNKKQIYVYKHTHSMYVCMHDCMRSESESASRVCSQRWTNKKQIRSHA